MRDAPRLENVSNSTFFNHLYLKSPAVKKMDNQELVLFGFFTPSLFKLVLEIANSGTDSAQYIAKIKDVYMKLVNMFSILGLVALATACGSSQPSTNNYGAFGNTGYPQYGNSGNYSGGQALYNSSGVLIGYKHVTSLISGSASIQAGSNAIFNVQVNAGDKITLNMSNASYEIGSTSCLGGLVNINTNLHQAHALSSAALTLNGQAFTSGSIASSAGTLTLTAPLSALSANCTVTSYLVTIPYGVTKESCTNVNNVAMQCP